MRDDPETLRRWSTVAEDLTHLAEDWWNDPADAVVRRGSVILRRFLAEGVLQQAWKRFGFKREPIVKAPNLDAILGRDRSGVKVALAGGAHTGGVYVHAVVFNEGDETHVNPDMPDNALAHPFRLSEFSESAAVFIHGATIKRREIVKYFAHFEGGAHLHLSSRVRKGEEDLVRRIRRWEGQINVHSRDGLYFELLSIGQAIGRSDDCKRLAEAIRAAVGEAAR